MKLKQFKIQKKLHSSHSTEVQRATTIADGSSVIIKLANFRVKNSSLEDLKREYRITQELKSSYIVRPLFFDESGERPWLVTEDNRMQSLLEVLPEKGFTLSGFFKLAVELSKALNDIHNQGVIHKDLNLSNIIVDKSLSQIKIIDFAFASLVNEEMVDIDRAEALKATLTHISPEQTGRTNDAVTSRSDLYALGVCYFQMLTGLLPFSQEDPNDLIYSHIAEDPFANLGDDLLPTALQALIAKLLNKSPDVRYQSAAAVTADLEYLQHKTLSLEPATSFVAGERNKISAFRRPSKLYGRVKETMLLNSCLIASSEACQVIHLIGEDGTGKSELVKYLYSPVMFAKGYFAVADLDKAGELHQYEVFASLLNALVVQVLASPTQQRDRFSEVVQASVGKFGGLITSLVPRLAELIGTQPKVAELNSAELERQYQLLWVGVLSSFTVLGKPLVISLKHIEAIDLNVLEVLTALVELDPKGLNLIFSSRDDAAQLDTFRTRKGYTEIQMTCLELPAIQEWVSDFCGETNEAVLNLAEQICLLTGAVPKNIEVMLDQLVSRNLMRKESDASISIDLIAIKALDKMLVGHQLQQRVDRLGIHRLSLLKKLSILGEQFSVEDTAFVQADVDFLADLADDFEDRLSQLINSKYLVKTSNTLRFTSLELQRKLYDSLEFDTAKKLHLRYANYYLSLTGEVAPMQQRNYYARLDDDNSKSRFLSRQTNEESRKEVTELQDVSRYLRHYNIAHSLISDPCEKRQLAKLNLDEGLRLRWQGAFGLAEKYLEQALKLLPKSSFSNLQREDADLLNAAYFSYGQLLSLQGKLARGRPYLDQAVAEANTGVEKARVFNWRSKFAFTNGEMALSRRIAFEGLAEVGITVPRLNFVPSVLFEFSKLKLLLRGLTPRELLDLPNSTSISTESKLQMLGACILPCSATAPHYLIFIVLKMMTISIKEGASLETPVASFLYGMLLCVFGRYEEGTAFARLAIDQIKKVPAPGLTTSVYAGFAMYIHHWSNSPETVEHFYDKALDSVSLTGDLPIAALALSMKYLNNLPLGQKNLLELVGDFEKEKDEVSRLDNRMAVRTLRQRYQTLLTLTDTAGDGITIQGDNFDENVVVDGMITKKMNFPLCVFYIDKMQLCYLADEFEQVLAFETLALEKRISIFASIYTTTICFYGALARASLYRKQSQGAYLRSLKRAIKKFEKWSIANKRQYQAKKYLLQAEFASLKIRSKNVADNEAENLYLAALSSAVQAGNLSDEALIFESFARHYESLGLADLRDEYLLAAIKAYNRWGARNKSQRLQQSWFDGSFKH